MKHLISFISSQRYAAFQMFSLSLTTSDGCDRNSLTQPPEILVLLYLQQGGIEFVEEAGNEINVTGECVAGDVVGELSFFFGMPQSSDARSKLNSPGATLFTLQQEVRNRHVLALQLLCHNGC